ncbi:MAG: TrmH family RNA methyltransferase [Solirubrobacterales bacterium]
MITSKDNEQIKELRKLQDKRQRAKLGRFAAEGEDLVAAALAAGWEPEAIFVVEGAPAALSEHAAALAVQAELLDSASALGSGSRVIAVFEYAAAPEVAPARTLALHLDGVSDPGNVGTLIRSASAFCDGPVSLGAGCADAYSPKALRAAMGSTFARPPIDGLTRPDGAKIVALDADGDIDIRDYEPRGPVVLVAGGERAGLSELKLLEADVVARIAMRPDGPESLNVAMAATIALHELGSKLQTTVHAAAARAAVGGNIPPDEN